jgi:hypothetical protein
MTSQTDFTAEEWDVLTAAPWVAGVMIVMADSHVTGMFGEFRAMAKSVANVDAAAGAEQLVGALVVDMKENDVEDKLGKDLDRDESKEELMALLRAGADIVDSKCSPAEAAGYKRWVLGTAEATAEASRESGFFGIGGERVSAKEKAAIAEIQATLGI